MISALLAGLVAGYGVALPIGGVGTLLINLSARTTLRTGGAAALGVATVDGLYALLVCLAGTVIARVITPLAAPLHWAAAALLVTVAARTAVTALRRHRDRAAPTGTGPGTPLRAYLGFLGLTSINPATVLFFAAVVLGHGTPAGAGVVFALGAFLASTSWQLVLAGSGALAGRLLAGRRARLATALVSSAITVLLAAKVVL